MRPLSSAIAIPLRAAAASLLMGQGAEGLPVVHVRGYGNRGAENDASALIRPRHMDMFR